MGGGVGKDTGRLFELVVLLRVSREWGGGAFAKFHTCISTNCGKVNSVTGCNSARILCS